MTTHISLLPTTTQHHYHGTRFQQRGITLPELLIAITLIVMLTSIVMPGYTQLTNHHEVNADAWRLSLALQEARHTAITSGTHVTLCPSLDKRHCIDDWTAPLILFNREDTKGQVKSTDDDIITSWQASHHQIRYRGFGSNRYIRFTPRGTTDNQNGTFIVCTADVAKRVIIYKSGRARIATTDEC